MNTLQIIRRHRQHQRRRTALVLSAPAPPATSAPSRLFPSSPAPFSVPELDWLFLLRAVPCIGYIRTTNRIRQSHLKYEPSCTIQYLDIILPSMRLCTLNTQVNYHVQWQAHVAICSTHVLRFLFSPAMCNKAMSENILSSKSGNSYTALTEWS